VKRGGELKRTELQRKTGLARTGFRAREVKPAAASRAGPRRAKPIRAVSRKRAAENRVRAAVIAAAWPERPRCACGCGRLADDVHEVLSRARGGSITDRANMRPLARWCHDKATDEDPRFYDLGLVVHSWEAAA
jgi:5-methylcytosine-specific restriction endonuclease McrA